MKTGQSETIEGILYRAELQGHEYHLKFEGRRFTNPDENTHFEGIGSIKYQGQVQVFTFETEHYELIPRGHSLEEFFDKYILYPWDFSKVQSMDRGRLIDYIAATRVAGKLSQTKEYFVLPSARIGLFNSAEKRELLELGICTESKDKS